MEALERWYSTAYEFTWIGLLAQKKAGIKLIFFPLLFICLRMCTRKSTSVSFGEGFFVGVWVCVCVRFRGEMEFYPEAICITLWRQNSHFCWSWPHPTTAPSQWTAQDQTWRLVWWTEHTFGASLWIYIYILTGAWYISTISVISK